MKRLGQIVRETITELTKTEVDEVEKLDDFAEFFQQLIQMTKKETMKLLQ